MIIEFADPGLNPGYIIAGIATFIIGTGLFFLPFYLTEDENKIAAWPFIGVVISVVGIGVALGSFGDYQSRVAIEKAIALQGVGISQGQLIGDRITGAPEDGKYFSGVLVDLHPDSGYAYQVVELTELGD